MLQIQTTYKLTSTSRISTSRIMQECEPSEEIDNALSPLHKTKQKITLTQFQALQLQLLKIWYK